MQHDVQLREDAEFDFLERLRDKVKGNELLNYASHEANIEMPARGPQEVFRTVRRAMKRWEPFDMKRANNEWVKTSVIFPPLRI